MCVCFLNKINKQRYSRSVTYHIVYGHTRIKNGTFSSTCQKEANYGFVEIAHVANNKPETTNYLSPCASRFVTGRKKIHIKHRRYQSPARKHGTVLKSCLQTATKLFFFSFFLFFPSLFFFFCFILLGTVSVCSSRAFGGAICVSSSLSLFSVFFFVFLFQSSAVPAAVALPLPPLPPCQRCLLHQLRCLHFNMQHRFSLPVE